MCNVCVYVHVYVCYKLPSPATTNSPSCHSSYSAQSLFENLCYNLFIFKWRILSLYYNYYIITRFFFSYFRINQILLLFTMRKVTWNFYTLKFTKKYTKKIKFSFCFKENLPCNIWHKQTNYETGRTKKKKKTFSKVDSVT